VSRLVGCDFGTHLAFGLKSNVSFATLAELALSVFPKQLFASAMPHNRLPAQPDLSLAGYLLVAAPNWLDPTYGRTVCLVVRHDANGAIAILLNRSLDFDTKILWQQLSGENPPAKKAEIHCGGPQSGPVIALHNQAELAEFTSGEGVYFAAQLPHLQQLVKTLEKPMELKIIVGQADWPAGQLEQEFYEGKWLPLPVSQNLVFSDGDHMWARAMREVGNRFVTSIIGAHGQPVDVLSN
jgi:putative transcriptional regulator